MFPFAAIAKPAEAAKPESFEAAILGTRAPMLKEGVERIAAELAKSLQKMAGASTTVEASLGEISMSYVQKVIAGQLPSMAASLLVCPAIGCNILVSLDATLVHGLVELLCGGPGKEAPPSAARAVTPIDQKFAHIVFTLLAASVESDWADYGFGKAGITKIDRLTPDLLGPRMQEIGCADLKIKLFGREGTLRLNLPPAALDRFGANQLEAPTQDATYDDDWASHLRGQLHQAPIALEAYLDARDVDLQTLAELKIGQIIALPKEARQQAALMAQGRVLFRGEIGQADNRYSLRIDEVFAGAPTPPRTSPLFKTSVSLRS